MSAPAPVNTITICAYNRPGYLQQVLESLHVALRLCPEFQVERIFIGVDHGGLTNPMEFPGYNLEIVYWPEHLGVTEHPRRLLQYVFIERGSAFNLHLEDDTVLAPDAIRLVEWFRSLIPDPAHILSLHSRSTHYCNPKGVITRPDFGVWGWATTSYVARKYILPWWNHRRTEPLGWDHSLTDVIVRHNLKVLSPLLSRVENIGREGGAHQTPEGWDLEMEGLVCAGPDQMREIGDFHL